VLDLLVRDALVDRDPVGAVISVRKQSLVRRWAQDYGLTTTNHAVSVLAPRGINRLLDDLARRQGPYALTGSAAARAYPPDQAAMAPLVLPVIFVPDPVSAQRSLELRRAERGANMLLVEPFDDVVYRGTTVRDGLRYVSPSQAVVDLLTGPGRFELPAVQPDLSRPWWTARPHRSATGSRFWPEIHSLATSHA
jgi:hypothetical protein